jgi:hypothetical protein
MATELLYLDDGGVVWKHSGIVTGQEIIDANAELYRSAEDISAQRYQLVDCTAMESFDISQAEVQEIAQQDAIEASIKPPLIIAFVGDTDLEFGIGRMWSIRLSQANASARTEVFRDIASAKVWINAQLRGS